MNSKPTIPPSDKQPKPVNEKINCTCDCHGGWFCHSIPKACCDKGRYIKNNKKFGYRYPDHFNRATKKADSKPVNEWKKVFKKAMWSNITPVGKRNKIFIQQQTSLYDFYCVVIEEIIKKELSQQRTEMVEEKINGETSDGYHTFNELYEFRKLYNASLFNEWANGWKEGFAVKYDVHKSKLHSDGQVPFSGGWFIVVAELPNGQISNHYELKDWDLFDIPEKEKANKWDGHTEKDVISRLGYLNKIK